MAAGIPVEVPISTVNRLCSSGLQSIVTISNAIRTQQIQVGMAVGVESMSLKWASDLVAIARGSHQDVPALDR